MKISNLKWAGLALSFVAFASCKDDNNMDDENPGTPKSQVFVSSNTSSEIQTYNFEGESNTSSKTYTVAHADADGIFYDVDADILYQFNRTNNTLNAYVDFSAQSGSSSLSASVSASADIKNGRGIAKSGNMIVVAQDAGPDNLEVNAFYVYETDNQGNVTFKNLYVTDINLWGVYLEGSTLYAIEDNSSRLAVYNDFFSNNTVDVVTADMVVTMEGIVRTHGIRYDAASDVMVLTDVGDAGSDTDGAFHFVAGFKNKLSAAGDGGTIASDDQIRVAGSSSFMGNPVDIDYDSRTEMVFVAERANAGGRVLAFKKPTSSGDASPEFNRQVEGASSIYVAKK